MKFENVCQTALEYFQSNGIFRVLLPSSQYVMLVAAALTIVEIFLNLGGIISTLVFFVFFLSLAMTLAQCSFRMASYGLALYAVCDLITIITNAFKYKSLAQASLVNVLVYGLFAFLAYKKSLSFNR